MKKRANKHLAEIKSELSNAEEIKKQMRARIKLDKEKRQRDPNNFDLYERDLREDTEEYNYWVEKCSKLKVEIDNLMSQIPELNDLVVVKTWHAARRLSKKGLVLDHLDFEKNQIVMKANSFDLLEALRKIVGNNVIVMDDSEDDEQ